VGRRHEGPRAQGQALQRRPWEHNPLAAFSAASYALNAKVLTGMADAVQADEKTRQRIRFAVEQWVAMAPSNFLALNPDAQQKAIETRESIAKGVQNLLHDIQQGHVSMTDERVRGGEERGHHRRRGGVENEYFPADRIQAADGQGA
jgi:polyhydroxyalkanoate synthase